MRPTSCPHKDKTFTSFSRVLFCRRKEKMKQLNLFIVIKHTDMRYPHDIWDLFKHSLLLIFTLDQIWLALAFPTHVMSIIIIVRGAYLWGLRPLPADRHQDVVGRGSRGGGGGAAGHCRGPAFSILAWRALQVIITPTDDWRLPGWTQTNEHAERETMVSQDTKGKREEKIPLFVAGPLAQAPRQLSTFQFQDHHHKVSFTRVSTYLCHLK